MKKNQLLERLLSHIVAEPGKKVDLADFDPGYTGKLDVKDKASELLAGFTTELAEMQDKLYAQDRYALLIIFQAMDAAGKDSTIKHVMSGVNPQGVQVYSFKQPSVEELDHTYLWRTMKALPERGRIGIHNRSHYEEVLAVRVHPEYLTAQHLPPECVDDHIWTRRFEQINQFERYLVENGTHVLKFFLHVSKEEQRKRFLKRIAEPDKNWKFSLADVNERRHWETYQHAYQDVFTHTSTKWVPWHIVPADHKWFTRLAVSKIILHTLEKLDLHYPKVSDRTQATIGTSQAVARERRMMETLKPVVVAAAELLVAHLALIGAESDQWRAANVAYPRLAKALDDCLSTLAATNVWGIGNRVPSGLLWNIAGEWLQHGEMLHRARFKPRGYAGDDVVARADVRPVAMRASAPVV